MFGPLTHDKMIRSRVSDVLWNFLLENIKTRWWHSVQSNVKRNQYTNIQIEIVFLIKKLNDRLQV